jgi:three-Cys-motif partner protein
VWPLEPHTEAKHRIVRGYLEAWYPIMASREKVVGFIDGFAGPGVYQGGEPGSPIIALETLLDHREFSTWTSEFKFLFIEEDATRAQILDGEVKKLEAARGGFPKNVSWGVEQGEFIDFARGFNSNLTQGKRLVPALALVDPFGFSGVPMADIAQLLQWSKTELIFNFMFDSLNRWATSKTNALNALDDLFGCADYRQAPSAGQARKDFLRDLYDRQLRQVGGFAHVRHFEMVTTRGRTGNYLFFGTRHEKGLSVMKQAMWKVDPQRGSRFAVGNTSGQGAFAFATKPDLRPLRAQIEAKFSGQTTTIEQVERFVCVDTDYLEKSHLKRGTLVPMEKAGEIVKVDGRTKAGSFPKKCKITFA